MKHLSTLIIFCFFFIYNNSFGQRHSRKKDSTLTPIKVDRLSELNKPKKSTRKIHDGLNTPIRSIDARNLINLPSVNTPVSLKNLETTSSEDGFPIFLRSNLRFSDASIQQRLTPELKIKYAITELRSLIFIKNPDKELVKISEEVDDKGIFHIKFQQQHEGTDIHGAQITAHLNGDKFCLLGRWQPSPYKIENESTLSENDVISIVYSHNNNLSNQTQLTTSQQEILEYHGPIIEKVIYPIHKGQFKYVYHVTFRPNFLERFEYFIDAQEGNIIDYYNNTCSDGPATASAQDINGNTVTLNTYLSGSNYYLLDVTQDMFNGTASSLPGYPVGAIATLDAKNTDLDALEFDYITSTNNTWNAPNAVSAHNNAKICYEYFKNTHNRNSIDGKGGTVYSFINTGIALDNAYWNGQAMFYGNGDVDFEDFTGSLDVAGHEMTHGVVGNTANLVYQGQSGALNESFSDIFGVMIDRDDWNIGEDVTNTSYIATGNLRSLSDPHNGGSSLFDAGWQPKHMDDLYTGVQDNGGVHINSGIPNHAFYLYAQAVGKDKAELVFYKALTQYLSKNSEFVDCRLAVIQSAKDLYGDASTEVTSAETAFGNVGIGTGDWTQGTEDLPDLSGDDYIASMDINNGFLFASPEDGSYFEQLSGDSSISKASFTEDASEMVYVAGDLTIRWVDLATDSSEFILSADPVWWNVSISRDGSKMAAVKYDNDSSIHVYDFVLKEWKTFKLYNPTYTEGIKSYDVTFADALEWDHTGEYILYDAYNEIKSGNGDNIEYYDIGFIKVWDNDGDTWSDGDITKVFKNIPQGYSVGYPTFSKNSPNIISFDMVNETDNIYWVMGLNLDDGTSEKIYVNNEWGSPSYNPSDSRICFTTWDDFDWTYYIVTIALQQDKISSTGNLFYGIYDGDYATWYVQGERLTTGGTQVESTLKQIRCYPNPTNNKLTVDLNVSNVGSFKLKVTDIMGVTLLNKSLGFEKTGWNQESLDFSSYKAGQYFVTIESNNGTYTKKIVKY